MQGVVHLCQLGTQPLAWHQHQQGQQQGSSRGSSSSSGRGSDRGGGRGSRCYFAWCIECQERPNEQAKGEGEGALSRLQTFL
uniref:Uncharacterized protein n=1 Tax=Tetradesmus obliquus TaxID=3088 RepID=A0A383V4E8_TETOB